MHHGQSYTVTKSTKPLDEIKSQVQVNLPQPHVNYSSKSTNSILCSGWCPFVLAGILSIVFLLSIYILGREKVFLVAINPTADLVPTIKQGSLQVYPFLVKSDIGIETRFFSNLPPRNLSAIVNSMDALFQGYPAKHEPAYRNCWLEHPTADHPCFFDASWLEEVCTEEDSYGYEERDAHFNPCFVMRLEQTGDWKPRISDHPPKARADHYDPGFSSVQCYAKPGQEQPDITVYPSKGFSHLFFPASRFDSMRYLMPMVAVKLHRIPKGRNITIECSVVTPNAFFLWNNGKAVMRFEAA